MRATWDGPDVISLPAVAVAGALLTVDIATDDGPLHLAVFLSRRGRPGARKGRDGRYYEVRLIPEGPAPSPISSASCGRPRAGHRP